MQKMKIEKAYGTFEITEPDGNVIKVKDVDSAITVLNDKIDKYDNPDVEVVTYASDEKTIEDAMDLTMIAAMCCWGKQLYTGDSIKLQIHATYQPEEK